MVKTTFCSCKVHNSVSHTRSRGSHMHRRSALGEPMSLTSIVTYIHAHIHTKTHKKIKIVKINHYFKEFKTSLDWDPTLETKQINNKYLKIVRQANTSLWHLSWQCQVSSGDREDATWRDEELTIKDFRAVIHIPHLGWWQPLTCSADAFLAPQFGKVCRAFWSHTVQNDGKTPYY